MQERQQDLAMKDQQSPQNGQGRFFKLVNTPVLGIESRRSIPFNFIFPPNTKQRFIMF